MTHGHRPSPASTPQPRNRPPRLIARGKPREIPRDRRHASRGINPAGVDGICDAGPRAFSTGDILRAATTARTTCRSTRWRSATALAFVPIIWYGSHGNGWNAPNLGLEIEGRYAGVEHDDAKPPAVRCRTRTATTCARRGAARTMKLDDVTIATARRGIPRARRARPRTNRDADPLRVGAPAVVGVAPRGPRLGHMAAGVVLDYTPSRCSGSADADRRDARRRRIAHPAKWDPAASAKY